MSKAPATKKAAPAKQKAAPAKQKAAAVTELEVVETEAEAEPETVTEPEADAEPTREAPAMEAAGEPTDFDHLLDLARVVNKNFGSEMPQEGTQNFLLRLLTAVADTSMEQFESLPETAQTWYENAVAQGTAKEELTPPDGYIKPAAAAKATAKKTAAKEKAAAKVKTPKAPKAPKEKAPRTASKTMPVRLAVCANPKITLDELIAALPTIGKSTLSTTRSDTLATLEAAQKSGWAMPSA